MLSNFKEKKIYIAIPKTATTAIENQIRTFSKEYERNILTTNDNQKVAVSGKHASLKEIANILKEDFRDYNFFALIRDPISCTISKYRYYKYGRAYERMIREPELQSFKKKLKVKLARLLPFSLWVLIYPLKINLKYLMINNSIPTNVKCHTFERFKKYPKIIYDNLLEEQIENASILLENKTKSNNKIKINIFSKFILKLKLREEYIFYNMIKENESL